MTQVLWFSRHPLSAEQEASLVSKLGPISVTQVNGTAPNVHVPFEAEINAAPAQEIASFKALVSDFQVLAIVAPIGLQQQILGIAGDKPVIIAKNARKFEGGDKVTFEFVCWEQLHEVKIVTSIFAE